MCQTVSGPPQEFTREYTAWKVVDIEDPWEGPFFYTEVKDGWSKSVTPESGKVGTFKGLTTGGYHVFESKEGAMAYKEHIIPTMLIDFDKRFKVIKVTIKGKAIPFTMPVPTYTMDFPNNFHGWAVEQWKPAEQQENFTQ